MYVLELLDKTAPYSDGGTLLLLVIKFFRDFWRKEKQESSRLLDAQETYTDDLVGTLSSVPFSDSIKTLHPVVR